MSTSLDTTYNIFKIQLQLRFTGLQKRNFSGKVNRSTLVPKKHVKPHGIIVYRVPNPGPAIAQCHATRTLTRIKPPTVSNDRFSGNDPTTLTSNIVATNGLSIIHESRGYSIVLGKYSFFGKIRFGRFEFEKCSVVDVDCSV